MNYKSLYLRFVGASDGVGLRSQIHLVARLRAATSVDTKDSKLLGNKGLCRKLAFYGCLRAPFFKNGAGNGADRCSGQTRIANDRRYGS